jgi:hypothetical protein
MRDGLKPAMVAAIILPVPVEAKVLAAWRFPIE